MGNLLTNRKPIANKIYDPSKGPTNGEELITFAEKFDFLHVILVDIHGIPRVKVMPSDEIKNIVKVGVNFVVCALAFTVDGYVVAIPDHTKMHFGNIRTRAIIMTAREWPWWNESSKTSALQIFVEPEWLRGPKIECDPRRIALRQLKRLHDRKLDIFWGTECEFRLFNRPNDPTKNESYENPDTATNSLNMLLHPLITQYEHFYTEINRRIRAVGFKFNTFHTEYGPGQVEIVLDPQWGIKHADDLIRLKMIARDVAKENGYQASFMTKPMPAQTGNGYHLSHSIWKKSEGRTTWNAMLANNDGQSQGNKMSEFSQHWLAGLLHHAKALTALTSPTVNCYRRLHNPWAPTYADWEVEDRFSSFRFKSGGTAMSTYLENRSPSSASNPYLCLAATIAAGLDGVEKELPLVDGGSKEMGLLPKTLGEALEALKNDEMFKTELGEQFIEWFECVKSNEMEKLKTVVLEEERPEDFVLERKQYFDFI